MKKSSDVLAFGWVWHGIVERKNSISRSRLIHSQVERNDKLTTKICGKCFDKVNEFALFRKICAATDIRMRIALFNAMEVGEAAIDVSDAPIVNMSLSDEDANEFGANKNSAVAEM